MAKGSEQFAWKLYPGVPRLCRGCSSTLRVKDVGEVRCQAGVYTFLCVTCQQRKVRVAVEETIARLGI